MHTRFSILALLLSILGSSARAEWRLCSTRQPFSLNVTDVLITPSPIKAGDVTHFTIIGSLENEETSGTLEASVKYLGFKVFTKSGNLCDSEGGPIKCPLLPGATSLDLQETMPGFLPPGKMVLTLSAARNGSIVFCVDIDLNGSGNRTRMKKNENSVSASLVEEFAVSMDTGSGLTKVVS
jgi:hypothetical protein